MSDKHYCIYSKIVAVVGTAVMFYLTGSTWSFLCLLLAASIDGELESKDE